MLASVKTTSWAKVTKDIPVQPPMVAPMLATKVARSVISISSYVVYFILSKKRLNQISSACSGIVSAEVVMEARYSFLVHSFAQRD
jgi:hypothetical protein